MIKFARPGSALRAASRTNPRVYPCPTCGTPNTLTMEDVRLGYQCDYCAEQAEGYVNYGYDPGITFEDEDRLDW